MPRLLLTVRGPDHPGVTASLFTHLHRHGAVLVDVEQVVVRGALLLGIRVDVPGADGTVPDELRDRLTAAADVLGVDLEVVPAPPDGIDSTGAVRQHVTLLAPTVDAGAFAAVAEALASCSVNIERIEMLASEPVTAYELTITGGDVASLREKLAAVAAESGVDLAVQPAGLVRRGKRLVVFDVDSTLVQGEVVDELAALAGVGDQVARVTAAAMRGELEFAASLRARVALLEGLPVSALQEVRDRMQLTPGASTLLRTLRRMGYSLGVVSGGFTQIVEPLAADLGLDIAAANVLEIVGGKLTGGLVGPLVDRPGKAEALRRFAAEAGVPLPQTVAVGDGANDLDMLATAGLGVAFNAKPAVRAAAQASVSVPFLDALLFLLGVPRDEVDAADLQDDARSDEANSDNPV
ncbi:MAG: phosphoserine phosphatase [Frankiaceae bacterium]|nr:phosphoserine phosphatase [Frankiaceae bacterium]